MPRSDRVPPSSLLVLTLTLSMVTSLWCAPAARAAPPVAACRTVDCLRGAILGDKAATPSVASCKPLGGQMDEDDLKHATKTDLGPMCRLVVGRWAAARRAPAPCMDRDSITPDWDHALDDKYSLQIQNALLSERPLREQGIPVPPAGPGFNNSTIYGTYVFDRQFRDKDRSVRFATYFCIADKPQRYVPYYYILTVGGRVVDDAPVTGPVDAPILRQVAKFQHEDDQRNFLFVDLNGDRVKDVALLRRAGVSKTFSIAACLYNPKGTDCVPVVGEPVTFEESGAFHLSFAKDRTVIVDLVEYNDPPIGEWRFRLVGTQLKLVGAKARGRVP